MPGEQIEAVFENGIFRPLQPVHLPEHQRVMLVLPAADEQPIDETLPEDHDLCDNVGYEPLALAQRTTIRVRLKRAPNFGPVPYPIEADGLESE